MIGRIVGADIRVETELHADLLLVKADAGRVSQIVLKLATNSRDAMPTGGRLVIRRRTSLPKPVDASSRRRRTGRSRCSLGRRYRNRHGYEKDAAADVRTVLHNQAGRARDWPGPVHSVWHCFRSWGPCRSAERTRQRNYDPSILPGDKGGHNSKLKFNRHAGEPREQHSAMYAARPADTGTAASRSFRWGQLS